MKRFIDRFLTFDVAVILYVLSIALAVAALSLSLFEIQSQLAVLQQSVDLLPTVGAP